MTDEKSKPLIKIPNLHYIAENYSSSYLLPIVCGKGSKIGYKAMWDFGLINIFVGWEDTPYIFKDCLFALFNPSIQRLKDWNEFYHIYSKEPNYHSCWDIDINVIVVVFKIPEKYKEFPKWLLEGKYSKFGKEYANNFLKLYINPYRSVPLVQYRVINKTKDYREKLMERVDEYIPEHWELCQKPEYEKEVLNYSKLKENYGK